VGHPLYTRRDCIDGCGLFKGGDITHLFPDDVPIL
jgi:hypothetical protein